MKRVGATVAVMASIGFISSVVVAMGGPWWGCITVLFGLFILLGLVRKMNMSLDTTDSVVAALAAAGISGIGLGYSWYFVFGVVISVLLAILFLQGYMSLVSIGSKNTHRRVRTNLRGKD